MEFYNKYNYVKMKMVIRNVFFDLDEEVNF